MNQPPPHIIRRQVLQIEGLKEADASQVQEQIGKLFKEKVIPLLDQYFSKYSPETKIHRIEKLELDIGKIPIDDLEASWLAKVTEAIENYFQKIEISKSIPEAQGIHHKTKETFDNPRPGEEVSKTKRHLELIRYFVATGTLPWWVDTRAANPVKESFDFLIAEEATALQALMRQWVKDTRTLKRILRQFRFPNWLTLATLHASLSFEDLKVLIASLLSVLKEQHLSDRFSTFRTPEVLGLQFLSWTYGTSKSSLHSADFWKGFLLQVAQKEGIDYKNLFRDFIQRSEKENQLLKLPAARVQELLDTLKKYDLATRDSNPDSVGSKQIPDTKDLAESAKSASLKEMEESPESPEPTKETFSDSDELLVNNAGLVILWPFLPRFFENLNLISERQFIEEAAAHRAVGLLQFLADGQDIPNEFDCGLNKILCGLDWQTVLDFGAPITAEEQVACETLLQAVITNAPILGEMSIDGLRGSFLLRKGILKSGAGVWQLQVERKTYDVVLDQFPWSWSMVKLPWMEWGMVVE